MTNTAPTDDSRARIDRYLKNELLTERAHRIEALAGDASERHYFRLWVEGLSPRVVVIYPEGAGGALDAFVSVAGLLATMPVPVPRMIARADELGLLVLEDLGDVSLQRHLQEAAPAERAGRYRDALAILVTLQHRGAELASSALPPYGLALDEERLSWELDFFTTHFLEGHLRREVAPAIREALTAEFRRLTQTLAAERRVLCHRDYHCRNLMVQGDRLCVIDFQDARMGPDTYDLASLLRDAYVNLTAAEVDAYVDLFLHLRAATTGAAADANTRTLFRHRLDRMAVQRSLKVLGTFAYQSSVLGNPVYLEYVPRTLEHARASLAATTDCGPLRSLLAELVPELG